MKIESKSVIWKIIQILIFGSAILLLIIGITYWLPREIQPGQSNGYPPPGQANADLAPTETAIPYPGPYWLPPTPGPTATYDWPLPTLGSIDSKTGATLSPSQIAAEATYNYERRQMFIQLQTPHPMPTLPSMSVFSLADLPEAIYNLSLYINDLCIQAKTPGQLLLVKSLMIKYPDYYLVPFYNNNVPCRVLVVTLNNEQATILSELPFLESVFPSLSAEEAVSYVTQKSGLKVSDQPILVFKQFRETLTGLTDPCWRVTTTDGQVYFVFFMTGIFDGNQVSTKVYVYNQEELHPIP